MSGPEPAPAGWHHRRSRVVLSRDACRVADAAAFDLGRSKRRRPRGIKALRLVAPAFGPVVPALGSDVFAMDSLRPD